MQDKTSNPPTPPAGFTPPSGGGGGTPASAHGAPPVPVTTPAAAPPTDPLKQLEDDIADEERSLTDLTIGTQILLNNAALAMACFKDLQGRYHHRPEGSTLQS